MLGGRAWNGCFVLTPKNLISVSVVCGMYVGLRGGLLDERPIFGRRELTMHFCFPHMS